MPKYFRHYHSISNLIFLACLIIFFFEGSYFFTSFNDITHQLIFFVFLLDYSYNLYVYREDVRRYIFSFMGIIDLLAVVISPIFKCFRFFKDSRISYFWLIMRRVLVKEKDNIIGILLWISIIIVVFGYCIYAVEVKVNPAITTPFDAIYYTLVAMSTAGFGDVYVVTALGRIFTMLCILIGNSIFVIFPMIISIGFYDEMKQIKFQDVRRRTYVGKKQKLLIVKKVYLERKKENKDYVFIDIRYPEQYELGHLIGAINIPGQELLDDPKLFLDTQQKYCLVGNSDATATKVAQQLTAIGFHNISVAVGGTIKAHELNMCNTDMKELQDFWRLRRKIKEEK